MESTAVSVGKAVLDGALGYAKSKAAEEIALQLGVERDVTFITDELQMMQSFLMTADEERGENKVLTTWVKQVRDLAYNVEDNLMDFGIHSEKKPFWGCIPRDLCDRRRIAKEVKDLRAKVEDVSNRNLRYRLIKDGSISKHAIAAATEQASIANPAMFGINEAKSKVDLLELISSEEENLRVIAVWGTSGDLGKTYEIRAAYDGPQVLAKFGCRAWVRLMRPFNPKEFLKSLLRQFYENSPEKLGETQRGKTVGINVLMKMESMGQSDIALVFDTLVSDNSYLIVIDDLSTIVEWDCIKKFLPNNKNRSRIIVSAQQAEIASLCPEKPLQVTELKQLSSDQTIFLFHKEVMPSSNSSVPVAGSITTTTIEHSSAMSTGEIEEDQRRGGDKVSNSAAGKKFDRCRTMALVDEVFTGREKARSNILRLVGQPNDNQGHKVISVWGMGGLGKTTLVRSVYRSQSLGAWKRAWLTALRPFNHEVLIRSLASQLLKDVQEDPTGATATKTQKKNIATMGFQELVNELTRLLNTQKCLIVLDDISTTEEWDLVRSCLPNVGRIIVTTRGKNIAKHCSIESNNMYSLERLEDDAALDLFKKKVFKDKTENINLLPDIMEQARLILKKCDGLPLAISTIGGFLATKPKTATEWRKINGRISAELEINPELRTIKTVLMRSYDGLPYHLKSCFLYMSIFPEDHKIRRKRLVERWIAEGYAREMHGMTAKEVGDKYFDELLDRSMIIPGEGVNHYNGKIDSCHLHDIIREICISKAREENLVFTLEEGCCLSSAQGAIRHLVVSSSWERDEDVFEGMLDLSHVRSLTVFGEWRSYFISDKMRFLRILDLEDTFELRDHHLDQIGQLLHLKYLSLRGCRNILQLPNSFGNLRHLQTLDVRGTHIFELPTTITKLSKLQHVRASDDFVRRQDAGTEDDILLDKFSDYLDDLSKSVFSSRCCCALSVLCAGLSYVRTEDRPEEACEEAGLQDTTVRKKHGWISCRLPHIFRSLLFQSRMRLFSASFFLSMGHLFWRPQIIEDGLNMHDIFRIYRTAKVCVVDTDDFTGTLGRVEIPRGFGKLKALHTLDILDVALDKGKAALKELGKLTQLRKLGVAGINSKNSEKFWSAIAGHNQLRSLSVRGSELDGGLGKDVLPPKHLESLKLEGKLVKVTEWIRRLQNLSKLQLESTELKQDVMLEKTELEEDVMLEETKLERDVIQVLGMLPNLAALRLRCRSFVGKKLHFQGSSFPSLMVLELDELSKLKSVLIEEQAMPKLELLQADWCRMEISGLAFITSLKEIRMGDNNSHKLKEEVKSQVAEHLKHVSLKLI